MAASRLYPSQLARQAVVAATVLTNAGMREAASTAAAAADAVSGDLPADNTSLAAKFAAIEGRLEALEP